MKPPRTWADAEAAYRRRSAEERERSNVEAWAAIEYFLCTGLLAGREADALVKKYAPTTASERAERRGLRVIEGGKKV